MIKAVIFDCFGVLTTIDGNTPDDKLFAFIRDELKVHYKIGMLSNANANWLDELFEPWQVKLFDEVALSYQVGAVKPEAAIYQLITGRLGALPEECLFVDDVEGYCEAAARLGMRTIWHRKTEDTIASIKELLHA